MNWFERLTGFTEGDYAATQSRLLVEGDEPVSTANGKRYGIGQLSLPTLAGLRARVNPARGQRSSARVLTADVRHLHADPDFEGALFQVASQFNLLGMVSERGAPEQGVSGYAYDPTQGPACAISAGAGTIYRNYLVPVGDGIGQTRDRQLDALAGVLLGAARRLFVSAQGRLGVVCAPGTAGVLRGDAAGCGRAGQWRRIEPGSADPHRRGSVR